MIYIGLAVVAVAIVLGIGWFLARRSHKKRDREPPDDIYPLW